MSDFMRVQVAKYRASDLPIDHIINTVYFRKSGVDLNDPDWQQVATDVANLFGSASIVPAGYDRITAKVYDMEDPTPRPIKAQYTSTSHPLGSSASIPREVALCLSFYSGRNLPRNRGRIYVGPIRGNAGERPGPMNIQENQALAQGLADIGGTNIQWCVYSKRSGTALSDQFKKVSHTWVDDEWDTIRGRGLRATSRNLVAREG